MYKTILGILLALPVMAAAGTVTDVGKTTRQALEKQSQGTEAAPTRPILKDVADRTYERYLKSFTYPIPNQFEREKGFLTNN